MPRSKAAAEGSNKTVRVSGDTRSRKTSPTIAQAAAKAYAAGPKGSVFPRNTVLLHGSYLVRWDDAGCMFARLVRSLEVDGTPSL